MTNLSIDEKMSQQRANLWALIPCGGTGKRANSEAQSEVLNQVPNQVPKQYRVLAGQPMILHTLTAFAAVRQLQGVMVVVAPDDGIVDELLETSKQSFATVMIANKAGNTRADTVFNGLKALRTQGAQLTDWVLVHDAARCLIAPNQINALIAACQDDEVGGLLALPLADTLKHEESGRVAQTLDRSDKWLAQTPQMFKLGALLEALEAAKLADEVITDESSAMEREGFSPKLVRGSSQNFKITYPEDFALAEAVLLSRQLSHAK
ncbi:MAG TPA: 2-C-methyl-D-erythritol 4-phosphate cytidylyltransferase [Burkholderiaceae bacterium]|nr:2-C-methyl-D-erythritol 4-phosphate cytidylyltransferase [Burkholderiaceae bacterium]